MDKKRPMSLLEKSLVWFFLVCCWKVAATERTTTVVTSSALRGADNTRKDGSNNRRSKRKGAKSLKNVLASEQRRALLSEESFVHSEEDKEAPMKTKKTTTTTRAATGPTMTKKKKTKRKRSPTTTSGRRRKNVLRSTDKPDATAIVASTMPVADGRMDDDLILASLELQDEDDDDDLASSTLDYWVQSDGVPTTNDHLKDYNEDVHYVDDDLVGLVGGDSNDDAKWIGGDDDDALAATEDAHIWMGNADDDDEGDDVVVMEVNGGDEDDDDDVAIFQKLDEILMQRDDALLGSRKKQKKTRHDRQKEQRSYGVKQELSADGATHTLTKLRPPKSAETEKVRPHRRRHSTRPRKDEKIDADKPPVVALENYLQSGSGATMKNGSLAYLLAILSDATLSEKMFQQLVELNCVYRVGVHIVAVDGAPFESVVAYHSKYKEVWNGRVCAPMILAHANATDRVAFLRDCQRLSVEPFFRERAFDNGDVVAVVNLGLHALPSTDRIMSELYGMATQREDEKEQPYDAVCAMEVLNAPFGYYAGTRDTVFVDGSFAVPLADRIQQDDGGNHSVVTTTDLYGSFNQGDLTLRVLNEAKKTSTGTMPVKSCFGGFVVYRALTFFETKCRYDDARNAHDELYAKYATKDAGVASEHVVFHLCVFGRQKGGLVVRPTLVTQSDAPRPASLSRIKSGGTIASGLREEDGLVLDRRRPHFGDRLEKGDFVFRMDAESGRLVLERQSFASTDVLWSPSPWLYYYRKTWSFMFVTLTDSCMLLWMQQVPKEDAAEGSCREVEAGAGSESTECRVVVWSSPSLNNVVPGRCELALRGNGEMAIVDERSGATLWSLY